MIASIAGNMYCISEKKLGAGSLTASAAAPVAEKVVDCCCARTEKQIASK